MKFIILLYAKEGAWGPEEHKVALDESIGICHELAAEGQYLAASPLQPPATASCVRVREGKSFISDGPFAETKEQLGGYFLVDVPSREAAIALARRIPGTHRGIAEIRPLMEVEGLPEGPSSPSKSR